MDAADEPAGREGGGATTPIASQGEDFDTWTRILTRADSRADQDRNQFNSFVKRFRDGHFTKDGAQGAGVSVNQLYAYVMMLLASLYQQAPAREVEAREGGDANAFGPAAALFGGPEKARIAFAEHVEEFLNLASEDAEADLCNNVVLQEALLRGLGYCKVSFDPARGLPRLDALRRYEIYVDPSARYSLRQAGYMIQRCVMPVDEARRFFQQMGGPADIEPNARRSEAATVLNNGEEAKDTDLNQFDFYEIWLKGERQTVLYRAKRGSKWLFERPWPYALASDEFPYAALSFNGQYEEAADPFPELAVTDGLDRVYQEVLEFFRRHSLRSMAKPMWLDKTVFTDADVNAIIEGRDMRPRLVDPNGKPWESLYHIVELNKGSDTSYQIAEMFERLRNQVLGIDEMMRGTAGRKVTATEAEIREGQATLRLGRRQKLLDAYLARQCRLQAAIGRQLVNPQTIQTLLGPMAALLWATYNASPDVFAQEFDIGIAAGSTGERARREKTQRLNDLLTAVSQRNGRLMQAGQQPKWDEDALLIELARATNIRRPERYQIEAQAPVAAAGTPAPAPGPGTPVPVQEEQQPAGPMLQPNAPQGGAMPMPMPMMEGAA